MKISTKSRYALHLMLAPAMAEAGENLSVKAGAAGPPGGGGGGGGPRGGGAPGGLPPDP